MMINILKILLLFSCLINNNVIIKNKFNLIKINCDLNKNDTISKFKYKLNKKEFIEIKINSNLCNSFNKEISNGNRIFLMFRLNVKNGIINPISFQYRVYNCENKIIDDVKGTYFNYPFIIDNERFLKSSYYKILNLEFSIIKSTIKLDSIKDLNLIFKIGDFDKQ